MKPIPVTRKEQYLYALGEIQTLEPVTREEMYLANLCGQNYALPLPCRRYEQYLYKMNGGDIDVPEPVTRLEMFLYKACDNEIETPTPVTREEMYWDEYIKAYIETKTITGTLPLTFTTSETKLRSWVIYGADIEHEKTATGKSINFYTDEDKLRDWTIYGNDEVGKNKLEITAETTTVKGVTFTVDATNGTITASGQSTSSSSGDSTFRFQGDDKRPISDGVIAEGMIFSCPGLPNYCYCGLVYYDSSQVIITEQVISSGEAIVSIPVGTEYYRFYVRKRQAAGSDDVVFKPMIRPADTSADFEPYQQGIGKKTENGYIVPVKVTNNAVNIPGRDIPHLLTVDIPIGNAPLTAGESVSKTSTGVDIPTIADATNVVQTPLFYNQPTIEIEYSYTGIGERTLNMLDLRAYRTPVDTGVIVEEVNIDSGVLKFSLDSHSTGGKGLAFEGIPFENGKRYVIDLWNNGTMSTWNPSIRLRRRDTGADIVNVGGEFYQVGTNAFFFTYDESLAPEGAYLYIGTGMDKIVDVRSFYIAECPEGESRHFELFGYQVPFKADQTGQMISYMTKVYIGTEPLKAGESVSNTKDARTHIGENTLSTTLTDPVTMTIKYKE